MAFMDKAKALAGSMGSKLDMAAGGPYENVSRQTSENTQRLTPPPAAKVVSTDYAQKAAAKYRDSNTAASTVGVKPLGSFKKGGRVKKTGMYKLHKSERVLNAKQTKKMNAKGGLAAVLGGRG